jgi:hypothetical protein
MPASIAEAFNFVPDEKNNPNELPMAPIEIGYDEVLDHSDSGLTVLDVLGVNLEEHLDEQEAHYDVKRGELRGGDTSNAPTTHWVRSREVKEYIDSDQDKS